LRLLAVWDWRSNTLASRRDPSQLGIDTQEIRRALAILTEPAQVTELRVLNVVKGRTRPFNLSGYFNDHEALIKAASANSDVARGTYITLNPVNPDLLLRAANRVQLPGKDFSSTSDTDIAQRIWLPIDLDPVRPSGISSDTEEHESAIELAYQISAALKAEGWPDPVIADSGNGAHLLYRVDLEANDDGLVKRCLSALALRFDSERVKVDQTVFNQSRIWKLYGTYGRKGDATDERPHRISRILEDRFSLTPRALVEALGRKSPRNQPRCEGGQSRIFDLAKWIADSGLVADGPTKWKDGRKWVLPTCPWNPEHQNKSAFILQFENGAIDAGCHHASCHGKTWSDLRRLFNFGSNTDSASNVAAWEKPLSFERHNLPCFPTEALPGWLRVFVEALSVATQTPADLSAMLSLSVLAAACAKKFTILVKEGYGEPLNLFTVTALPSGNRKSAVFGAVSKPLREYEERVTRASAAEIARSQTSYKIKEATLKRAQDRAANADGQDREKFTREAGDLAAELDGMEVVKPARYMADDCTPEKLASLLRDQGGRIAVLSPEGDLFDLMAGRYSTNGAANLGVYLKGHAGDDLRIDRVNRAPEYVKAPALTVGLAVQPEVIEGLAGKPGFRGRGLLARFLYAMPASLLGSRDTNPPPVPVDVLEAYRDGVFALLSLPSVAGADATPEPNILILESAARASMGEFEGWLEPQLSVFGELGAMTDWGGKLCGAVARIAGLLHLAGYAGVNRLATRPISRDTVARAVRIGKYLIPHAKAAFSEMGTDHCTNRAKLILHWLQEKSISSFQKRELHQSMRTRFKKVTDLDSPLNLLVSRGFIRDRNDDLPVGPGRPPSPIYDVNPLWSSAAGEIAGSSEYCEVSEKRSQDRGDFPSLACENPDSEGLE
jgi:replicative DNA helicase